MIIEKEQDEKQEYLFFIEYRLVNEDIIVLEKLPLCKLQVIIVIGKNHWWVMKI